MPNESRLSPPFLTTNDITECNSFISDMTLQ
jgi:hypothetical protein